MRRLALVFAAVALIIVAARLWPDRTDTAAPTPTANPATPVPAETASAPTSPVAPPAHETSGPYGGTDRARRAWEPIVQGFALAYPDTDRRSHSTWLADLRPYLEPDLTKALARTDLEKIPHGHYAGYQPLKLGDDAITIRVTYQEGWALVLYLAGTGNNTWLVASLDEAVDFD